MKLPSHHVNAIRNQNVIPVCEFSHVNTPLVPSPDQRYEPPLPDSHYLSSSGSMLLRTFRAKFLHVRQLIAAKLEEKWTSLIEPLELLTFAMTSRSDAKSYFKTFLKSKYISDPLVRDMFVFLGKCVETCTFHST